MFHTYHIFISMMFDRMDFVEADMAHAQTPFYVVQNLITTLLQLEGCNSVSDREAKILDYIQDEDLKTELCLLNDLLGTHVRQRLAVLCYALLFRC